MRMTKATIKMAKRVITAYIINQMHEYTGEDPNTLYIDFLQSHTYTLLQNTKTHLYCIGCATVLSLYKAELAGEEQAFLQKLTV